jgi:hypothetical protein
MQTAVNGHDAPPWPACDGCRKERDSEFIVGGDPTFPEESIILLLDADTRVPERCIVQVWCG